MTLAHKHKTTARKITQSYGRNLVIQLDTGKTLASFIPSGQVGNLTKKFLQDHIPYETVDKITSAIHLSQYLVGNIFNACGVKGCTRKNIDTHHVRMLARRVQGNLFSVTDASGKRLPPNILSVKEALRRKTVPLCREHHKL